MVEFEDIMLREVNKSQKNKYCVISLVPKIVKFIESNSRMVVTRIWGEINDFKVSVKQDESVVEMCFTTLYL